MNFVAQLEDYLRDLGAEARKKHPGVKEASERAILRLRTLQNAYASAVRKAASSGGTAEHPTTSLFQSQDLLHPFLLAANYPNASTKLLDISFRAMRLLMESNAICPGDGIHMVRVWTIQAHVIMSQYQSKTSHQSKSSLSSKKTTNGTSDTAHAMTTTNNSGTTSTASSSSTNLTSGQATSSTASSWFSIGGLIGVASGSNSSQSAGVSSSGTVSSTSSAPVIKNAVSSSSGQSGQYATPSSKDMEKNALEILSCLLKLTELLKNETISVDLWTQSVSLCCLLLDFKKTVQQAARSTLPQVLSILYQTSDNTKYNLQTWEDLLLLASYGPNKKIPKLHGAFSQCRLDTSSSKAPAPPSPEFALELMATILKEKPDLVSSSDKFLSKTMGVTVALLEQTGSKNTSTFNLTKTIRVYQWTLTVLQTQAAATSECRELLLHLIKPIRIATDVCRSRPEHEDGFVYSDEGGGYCLSEGGPAGNSGTGGTPSNRSTRRIPAGTEISSSQHNHHHGGSTSNSNKAYYSLVPAAFLWRAGLAAETIYHILLYANRQTYKNDSSTSMNNGDHNSGTTIDKNMDARKVALARLLDGQTIVSLTEALSAFATVGASCQNHIIQLADVCQRTTDNHNIRGKDNDDSNSTDLLMRQLSSHDDMQQQTRDNFMEPMLFHRAEQLIKSGMVSADHFDDKLASKPNDKKSASSSSTSFASQAVPIMGESLWTAFHGVLEISVSVLPSASPEISDSLADGAFPPSLATLEHYMKRLPGSPELTRLALKGYSSLACLCMPLTTSERSARRKALLTSLCKLSLPTWGKHDATSQLQNQHVRSLICLLRIIHAHYDHIGTEWNIVLCTFEELSVMTISSPFLSDQMYHAALAVSAVYGRFAPFSTCFSNTSLCEFIDALATVSSLATKKRKLVTTNDNAVLDRVLVSSDALSTGEKVTEDGKETIGGKLVSLGVRAIYGAQSVGSELEQMYDVPIAKRTKSSYYEAYRNDFVRRLEATTTSSFRPDLVAMLPFGLALLADIAMSNSFRYKICVPPVSRHICNFSSEAPAIRTCVMDTIAMLILGRISSDKNLIGFQAPAKVVYETPKQHQLLAVEPAKTQGVEGVNDEVTQAELFDPICECIRTVSSAVVAETATTVLTSILESVGHNLQGEVWVVIIKAVASLSGEAAERRASEWSNCCLLGFRCLKLIVDDFLDYLPPPTGSIGAARSSLLDCCSSFGRSRHDVNTSLTAIGLLWTIADQDDGTDAIDRALSKLVELASDSRPEVRNCSVNTLFSCIVGRGGTFSATQWKSCICDTVFGVYDLVVSKASDSGDVKVDLDGNAVATSKSRYKVSIHHSRDSAGKQWITTQVLALQGLCRVLRSFFSLLLDHVDDTTTTDQPAGSDREDEGEIDYEEDESDTYEDESDYEDDTEGDVTEESERKEEEKGRIPWLIQAWSRILDFALQAAAQEGGRDTLDLRYAGVELLVLCGQLSCKAGIQAALTPARVGTNMQVINGALRDVGEPNTPKSSSVTAYQRSHSMITNSCRETLFATSMERMESYREFIEALGQDKSFSMEATQIQVLQKFVSCLSNLYDCCKDNEMSPKGKLDNKYDIERYLNTSPETEMLVPLESRFVRMLTSVAVAAASGGARFLSQAQRSAIDLLRSMMGQGSAEALFRAVNLAGLWIFCRKDDGGQENTTGGTDQSGTNILSSEIATIVAEEILSESITPASKVLALGYALSHFPFDPMKSNRKIEGRRKAYYKHFLPILREGLRHSVTLQEQLSPPIDDNLEWLLIRNIWQKLCLALSCMLLPIPDGTNLQKISRAAEVLSAVELTIDFVPDSVCHDLCAVLSRGASESLAVEKANRTQPSDKSEGEMYRKRVKYREDALTLFKTCYAGVCLKYPEDPGLLAITDEAFSEALAAINESSDNESREGVSVESFQLVCQAFKENPGLESLIVSSFPLLCRLVQTKNEGVRNAAASALGSIDLRQVLSDGRTRCEQAERRAELAEKEASELGRAVAELQRKNEMLQQQVALSSLHLT